jgi:hypothetical protein
MALSRRHFLTILGSNAIILPASACTSQPDTARAPWQQPRHYDDPMRQALSYALLAPTPHNRQPWVVDLQPGMKATLYCDLDRLLPQTDPFSRQIVIGLGCFLELFRMAAAQSGFRAEITPFPQGGDPEALDRRPIASMKLRSLQAKKADPLFAQVLKRRTNRNLYSDKLPSKNALNTIISDLGDGVAAGFALDTEQARAIQALAAEASDIEFDTPRTYKESVEVMRIGAKQVRAQPDGIVLEGPMLEALHALGMLNRKSLADPNSAMFRAGREDYAKGVRSANAFVWLTTPGNSRLDQIRAGAAYLRLNLAATSQGLAQHPLSQALQEYPEMRDALRMIHNIVRAKEGTRIQMLARIGYAKPVGPSPRWPLEAKIKPA